LGVAPWHFLVIRAGQVDMKLNFWQWLGVLLLLVGTVMALNKYIFGWWE
jgi:hypothetical protein